MEVWELLNWMCDYRIDCDTVSQEQQAEKASETFWVRRPWSARVSWADLRVLSCSSTTPVALYGSLSSSSDATVGLGFQSVFSILYLCQCFLLTWWSHYITDSCLCQLLQYPELIERLRTICISYTFEALCKHCKMMLDFLLLFQAKIKTRFLNYFIQFTCVISRGSTVQSPAKLLHFDALRCAFMSCVVVRKRRRMRAIQRIASRKLRFSLSW